FPEDGDLVPAGGQVAVDAVDRGVQHPVLEPADAEVFLLEGDILDLGRKGHPVQPLGLGGPEGVRGLTRLNPGRFIAVAVHVGASGQFSGDGIDFRIRHAIFLQSLFLLRLQKPYFTNRIRRVMSPSSPDSSLRSANITSAPTSKAATGDQIRLA